MKRLKLLLFLFVLFSGLVLLSCNDEKETGDEDKDKYEQLSGIWKMVAREGWEYKGQKYEYREDFTSGFEFYEFMSNGDGNISWENGTSYRYKWEIKNDILTIYFVEYYEDEESYSIAELSATSLILENKGFDPQGNDWCHRILFIRQ
ncbi:MAG: lipocalin family protein [Tannerellaceae bacterium]|nr:lipocalin family protein [Tannerellaceae bacterium]